MAGTPAGRGHPQALYDGVHALLFSPDGKHVAYAAWQQGKALVVVDARAGPPCDMVSHLVFSPDGSAVAYAALHGRRWSLDLNAQAYGACDVIMGPPVFEPDGGVECLVMNRRLLSRLWLAGVSP